MRKITTWILVVMMVLGLCVSASATPAKELITTTPTGYDSADDVVYVTYTQSGKTVIANWGARGEDCVFLSTYAENYYTGEYLWDAMSSLTGGTSTSNTPSSDLYLELQELMASTHTFYTYYTDSKNVREYYQYADCVSSDITQVALLYRGGLQDSEWNSGKIWNQEHTWPKSKLHSDEQIGDIMMLRPTNPSENSSRGNKAYGESSGCYDPGVSVRGDCARMMLYMYVRYGVTDTMWGTSGVMESLELLLRWMEEDPVDTWEMGRNDAVQSITGTRNVFVDYPEYAWLLFGQEVPEDMVTPSGEASGKEDTPCAHENTELRDAVEATCGGEGYTGDTYCATCGEMISTGEMIPATKDHTFGDDGVCTVCGYQQTPEECTHENAVYQGATEPTCGLDGYTGDAYCAACGTWLSNGEVIPATGAHENIEHRNQSDATCGTDGHTGDVYCADCGEFIAGGSVIPATGEHTFGQWNTSEDGATRTHKCTGCGFEETENIPTEPEPTEPKPSEPDVPTEDNWFYIAAAAVVLILIGLIAMIIGKKKKR